MQLWCELRQCPVRDVDRHDEVVLEDVDRHDEVVELELRQCPMHQTSFSNVDRHDEVEGPFGHVWQLHAAPPTPGSNFATHMLYWDQNWT